MYPPLPPLPRCGGFRDYVCIPCAFGCCWGVRWGNDRGGSPTGRPTHFLVTTHESSYSSSSPGAVAAAWMRENSGLSFEPDRVDADQTEADLLRVGVGGRVGGAMGASSACDLSQRLRSSTQRVEGLFEGSETEESEEKREEVVRWWDVDDAGKNAGGKLLAYEIPEHWCEEEETGYTEIRACG